MASPGFPSGSPLASAKVARLPISGVPNEKRRDAGSDALLEQHRAYELHAMQYGKIAVIHSAVGSQGSSRPHAYSDVVALDDGRGDSVATELFDIAQAVSFDGFMDLQEFWNLGPNQTLLEDGEWTPQSTLPASPPFSMPPGMREALLVTYWKTLTARSFDKGQAVRPVRLCLGPETDCLALIAQAKAFFVGVIAPALPRPAHNILSMSVPVPAKAILPSFEGTALAFLYPEETLPCEFDLRNGRFTPVSEAERQFAALLADNGQVRLLDEMYARYHALTGCASMQRCTFLADYDIAFALFCMERGLLDSAALLEGWAQVRRHLLERHGVTPEQLARLLEDMEDAVLGQLADETARAPIPLSEQALRFLLERAGEVSEEQFQRICRVISAHQASRLQPFLPTLLGEPYLSTPQAEARMGALLFTVLAEGFIDPPLDQAQQGALTAPAFVAMCKAHAPLQRAMADYLIQENQRHPQNTLAMLSLSTEFLGGHSLLRQTLNLLMSSHVERLPDREICENIRRSSEYMDEGNKALLDTYYVQCFLAHAGDPGALTPMATRIGVDMSAAFHGMLVAASETPALLSPPLGDAQLGVMIRDFLPMSGDRALVRQGLAQYIQAAFQYALGTERSLFLWMASVAPENGLITEDERRQLAAAHLLDFAEAKRRPPDEGEFETLLGWLSQASPASFADHAERGKAVYNAMGEAGREQLLRLLPYLGNTTAYPYVAQVHAQWLAERAKAAWQRQEYWATVAEVRQRFGLMGLEADAFLQGDTERAAQAKLRQEYAELRALAQYGQEMRDNRAQPADAFRRVAEDALRQRFVEQYERLFMDQCNAWEDLRPLELLAADLGVQDAVRNTDGHRCIEALRRTVAFIDQGMDQTPTHQWPDEVAKVTAQLLSCKAYASYTHMRRMLTARYLHAKDWHTGFASRKQTAIYVICKATGEGQLHVEESLTYLCGWDEGAVKKPYAPEYVHQLAMLGALYEALETFHPNYGAELCNFMLGKADLRAYQARVTGDKRAVKRHYPWMEASLQRYTQAAKVSRAFRSWLEGKPCDGCTRGEWDL